MNKCCQLLAKKKLKVTFIESASAGYLAYRFSLDLLRKLIQEHPIHHSNN